MHLRRSNGLATKLRESLRCAVRAVERSVAVQPDHDPLAIDRRQVNLAFVIGIVEDSQKRAFVGAAVARKGDCLGNARAAPLVPANKRSEAIVQYRKLTARLPC